MGTYFALALLATTLLTAATVQARTGPGSISPSVRDDRIGLKVERRATNRVLERRCRPGRHWPAVVSVWKIRRSYVETALQRELRRQHRARRLSSRCEVIPAWPWLALASCEAGRDWDYNGSSGFDGGYQFLPSTWTAAKGAVARARPYAYAWQAPAYVQYLVARSWLARTSWLQWPVCSARIGAR